MTRSQAPVPEEIKRDISHGRYSEAADALRGLVLRTPSSAILAALSDVNLQLGHLGEAKENALEAVAADAQNHAARVLLARVEALMRRSRSDVAEARETQLHVGRLSVDASRRAATVSGEPVELTTGDFDILWLLASRQGTVVTRDEILRVVRGIDYDGLDRSIDARICRLRKKLQEAGGAESMIKTVRLRGYLFAGEG